MRIRAAVSAIAAVALLVPAAAVAQNGPPPYQVSGGGQFDVPLTGPGSTIGFVAQALEATADGVVADARGQLQVVERNGPGPGDKFHGVVDCIIPAFTFDDDNGGVEGARFGGHLRGDPTTRFLVDVVDNGQPSEGTDLIAFHKDHGDQDCNNDDDVPEFELGRGNVKIHDRRPNNG